MRYEDADPIYMTRYGSHAFGLATPASDLDLRGVFVAPREYFLGFLRRVEHLQKDEDGVEVFLFEIAKFFRLAADANPSTLEILFTHPDDVVRSTPLGDRLRALGPDFLSRRIRQTFGGYAHQQLRRIRSHRRWLLDPPARPPERVDFGLPGQPPVSKAQLEAAESMIRKKTSEWAIDFGDAEAAVKIEIEEQIARYLSEVASAVGIDGDVEHLRFMAAAGTLGFDANFLDYLDRERHYRRAVREWSQYQEWLANRNPERSQLERRFGYDTKHAMHLVRLLRMAAEILATGQVRVRRPDREELLAIRERGIWSYEELVGWAERQEAELDALAASEDCPLPSQPNRKKLDAACVALVEEALGLAA